jgi:hypothetical protein
MRFTFVILLFCCLGADAQMIIKAHANYRPYAVAAQNLLLDDYPNAAAAYSLRKLKTAYTGAAIRVRKDTTGQPEQDIFFVGNELDTVALKSFIRNNNGWVVTWYDQSGNDYNLTQSTSANQPNIVTAGVITRSSGKPIIDYANTFSSFLSNSSIATGTPKTIFALYKKGAIQPREEVFFDSRITNQSVAYKEDNDIGNRLNIAFGTNQRSNYTVGNGDFKLLTIIQDGANGNAYINGSSIYGSNVNFGSNGFNGLRLGAVRGTASLYLQAGLYEFIIYGSNQSSNRTGLESNINAYYGIY